MKSSEKISKLSSLIKRVPHCIGKGLSNLTYVLELENKLMGYTSSNFLFAIKPTLKELSSWTSRPYAGYLNEAIDMILEGRGEIETMQHFDIELLKVKGRCKDGKIKH